MRWLPVAVAILGVSTAAPQFDVKEAKNDTLNCDSCKELLTTLKGNITAGASIGEVIDSLDGICSEAHGSFCKGLEQQFESRTPNTTVIAYLTDFRNALSLMDTKGLDGAYFCHYFLNNTCLLPETPKIDYSSYWDPEPCDLELPQSKGETFRVAHISDIHLSINYTESAPANCKRGMCCNWDSEQDPKKPSLEAPKYGHYNCDSPLPLVESSLQNAQDVGGYDFAIFTGDMADHDPLVISNITTIAEEETSMRALKKHLGDIPVYAVLGNHDSYPYAQDAPDWTGYSGRFTWNTDLMEHLWEKYGWIDRNTGAEVRAHHTAFAVQAKPGLKVISLNSNFWYRNNFYNFINTSNPDSSGLLKFLIHELAASERCGERVWIIAHVPPGGEVDEALPYTAKFFVNIVERFHKTIAATFFGHTHRDEFTVLYSGNNGGDVERKIENAINVAWVAPSITPYVNYNPAWRYYEVDADTFEVMDSVTYKADVSVDYGQPWDNATHLTWNREYSARDAYAGTFNWPDSMPLNGTFWANVAEQIKNNQTFAQKYMEYLYRGTPFVPDCDEHCQEENYCYTTSMTPDEAIACMSNGKSKRWVQEFRGLPRYPMPRANRI